MKITDIKILPAPEVPADATLEAKPPEPAEPATESFTLTPFKDSHEVVRAYPHPKYPGQFILADAANQVIAVCPNASAAQVTYESVNTFFQAMALREAHEAEQRAAIEKRIITAGGRPGKLIVP